MVATVAITQFEIASQYFKLANGPVGPVHQALYLNTVMYFAMNASLEIASWLLPFGYSRNETYLVHRTQLGATFKAQRRGEPEACERYAQRASKMAMIICDQSSS